MLGAAWQAQAQDAKAPSPSIAPLNQYLMERNAEIALARSAAPESISQDAEVMVLGGHGYETAVKGKNGFVCVVQRSWTAGIDDPDFWNPKLRALICFNPPAARSYLPLTIDRDGHWRPHLMFFLPLTDPRAGLASELHLKIGDDVVALVKSSQVTILRNQI